MKYFPILITTLTVQAAAVLVPPAVAQRVQPPAAENMTAAFDPATLPTDSRTKDHGQNQRFAATEDRTGCFQPLYGCALFLIRSRACQTDLPSPLLRPDLRSAPPPRPTEWRRRSC